MGTYINIIKVMYDKLTGNITLNGEWLKAVPIRSGTRQGCPVLPLAFNIILEAAKFSWLLLATAIREKKKEKKRNLNGKRSKTVTVCRWHNTVHRKSWRYYQKTTRAHQWIWLSSRTQNYVAFLYTNKEWPKTEIYEIIPLTITSKRIKY